jgi:hypothetical protein
MDAPSHAMAQQFLQTEETMLRSVLADVKDNFISFPYAMPKASMTASKHENEEEL